ncbi:MAG: SAM-dependent methyltransferase [Proteobacteria bacterium]|nr:SAM-dependent methyltransferase [Pseudomonadota bacterium]
MLISKQQRESLNLVFQQIRLKDSKNKSGIDKTCKIEQIIAYLEIVHANLRKYSKKRKLVLIDSGAGNCYLSFLVYYFYSSIEEMDVTIHCVDLNNKLMDKCRATAARMGFEQMHFHACDILEFRIDGGADMVYSLHACNSATDKTIYLGVANNAATILSVSCCQHDIKRSIRNKRYTGITKHSVYKDKFVSMVGDSLRGLLLEMIGYKVSIFEFVSSRYTDKNVMLRAKKSSLGKIRQLEEEYQKIKSEFMVTPELEKYLGKSA